MKTYPEHEKLKALDGANQVVGDFIEWLSEKGYVLAIHDTKYERLVPSMVRRNDLIARYFDINEQALEEEKIDMLEMLRQEHEQRGI